MTYSFKGTVVREALVKVGQDHSRELALRSRKAIWATSEDIWASDYGLWEECPALGRVFLEGWGFSLLPHPHPYLRERDAASAHQPGLMGIVLPLEGDCLTKFEKLPSIFGLLAPKDFFFNILSLLYNFSWPENSVINNTWPRLFFLTSH